MKVQLLKKLRRTAAVFAATALLMVGLLAASPQPSQATTVMPAAHGWCDTATSGTWGGVRARVPTIGVGGSRNCLMNQGSVSEGVKAMQSALFSCHHLGTYDGIDGDWGPATTSVVRSFQYGHGLVADAWYGPATHNAMLWLNLNSTGRGICGQDGAV
ncbi:MAG: peptidoglycan-binding protein [Propionibacteriaceae bacterium]|jgi:murein L,D-transpeptidase YcbB/YkuD|nr:peptidoglycan-binding protein [Propionibacteriaceae bacterium]